MRSTRRTASGSSGPAPRPPRSKGRCRCWPGCHWPAAGPDGPVDPREAFLLDKLTRALTAGNREIAVEAAEAEAVPTATSRRCPTRSRSWPRSWPAETVTTTGWCCIRHPDRPARGSSAASACRRRTPPARPRAPGAEEAVCLERVFAEVVHLPGGTYRQHLEQPVLRGFTRSPISGAPVRPPTASFQCRPARIRPGRADRAPLRRLGREVIRGSRPRTPHHARSRRLPFPSARCSTSRSALDRLGLGTAGQAPFLPRVVSGRLDPVEAPLNSAT